MTESFNRDLKNVQGNILLCRLTREKETEREKDGTLLFHSSVDRCLVLFCAISDLQVHGGV